MGLLDLNWDALNSDQGRMALGLLAAAGPQERPMSFGQRLAGAMDQFRSQKAAEDERKQRAQQQALQTQLVQMQLAQAKAQQEQQQRALTNEEAFRNLLPSPQMQASSDALSGGGGPTVGNAANIKPVDPMAQLSYEAMKYGQIKPTDYLASLRKDTTPMKVGRDDRLIDPVTKRVVLDALPKEEATPADWKLYQLSGAQQRGIGFDQWDQARKRAGATNVSVNTGQHGFDNTLKLRGDFRSEPVYKAHQEMQSAYSQIKEALGKGNAVGDLAGATKIMKLLDPGSVVRESELGMAMAATGLLDRVSNYASMVANGNKLTPKQRVEFQGLADALFSQSANLYNAKRSEYEGIAQRNGLNTADVLGPQSTIQVQPPKQVNGSVKFLGFE